MSMILERVYKMVEKYTFFGENAGKMHINEGDFRVKILFICHGKSD